MNGVTPLEAVVFDLDGVVTFTARLHLAAWKDLFDGFLQQRAERQDTPFEPFTEADYRAHVDGRPRLDGVRAFLASRGIAIPDGEAGDSPDLETIHRLGGRKNELFKDLIELRGVDVDHDAVQLVRELRASSVRVGVASSSRNVDLILRVTGLEELFEARVDGIVSARMGLRGKPAPDIFLTCLQWLGCADPSHAIVVEDAIAGVEAGRAGGFGFVLGVDRSDQTEELLEHGADRVVRSFDGVGAEQLRRWFESRMPGPVSAAPPPVPPATPRDGRPHR